MLAMSGFYFSFKSTLTFDYVITQKVTLFKSGLCAAGGSACYTTEWTSCSRSCTGTASIHRAQAGGFKERSSSWKTCHSRGTCTGAASGCYPCRNAASACSASCDLTSGRLCGSGSGSDPGAGNWRSLGFPASETLSWCCSSKLHGITAEGPVRGFWRAGRALCLAWAEVIRNQRQIGNLQPSDFRCSQARKQQFCCQDWPRAIIVSVQSQ